MDKSICDELEVIQDAIIRTVDPLEIYLFGSYAYGTPNADSDFDLYVVLDNGAERPLLAMQRIGIAISKCKRRPVDVLANTQDEFVERQKFHTVERVVAESGVKLYGRQELSQAMA